MNKYIESAKAYVTSPAGKKSLTTVAIIAGIILLITILVIAIYNSMPRTKIVYPPVHACDLLTEEKAQDKLGAQVIGGNKKSGEVSGNTVTTKCSYSDVNTESMKVVALAVRSGVNDDGVKQNKSEFAVNKSAKGIETVNGLGDSAYFNPIVGQLNILNGHDWIILSYGIGANPEANSLEEAVELAYNILSTSPELPTF